MQVEVSTVSGFDELGRRWRELEAEIPGLPFFRSWSWVGCRAEERYSDPLLVRAESDGRLVGLALFNRRRGRLSLTETGDSRLDAPFVEHNGPLRREDPGIDAAMFRAAEQHGKARRLVLSGVSRPTLEAAPGVRLRCQERPAPWVDLTATRTAGAGYLATLSANTRQQIRRSLRSLGDPLIRRAETLDEALEWFEAMIVLHERTWRTRGEAGAFATEWIRGFHRELLARAHPRGELDFLRLESQGHAIAYLYNFRLGDRVYAYQSGMQTAGVGASGKPGLTAHVLAIQRSLELGDASYDFLAGAQRYKTSLANARTPLFWAELVPRRSVVGLALSLARKTGLLAEA